MYLEILNARIIELDKKIEIEMSPKNSASFNSYEKIASRRRLLEYSVRMVEVVYLKNEFLTSNRGQECKI